MTDKPAAPQLPANDLGRFRTVTRGLDQPGIYPGVEMDDYHDDLCAGVSVSASTLVTIDTECEAKAYADHYLNPEREAADDTDAKAIGRAFHTLVLEPNEFADRFAIRPPDRANSNAYKAWAAEQGSRDFLTRDAATEIARMARAMWARPKIAHILEAPGQIEVTAIWKDPETGIWLKCRPDKLIDLGGGNVLPVNLKSALSVQPEAWMRQVWRLNYAFSAAMTTDILKALGFNVLPYTFVALEKKAPYLPRLSTPTDELIGWARIQYRAALHRFAAAVKSGVWPDYGDEVVEVGLPPWAGKQLQQRSERGDFSWAA